MGDKPLHISAAGTRRRCDGTLVSCDRNRGTTESLQAPSGTKGRGNFSGLWRESLNRWLLRSKRSNREDRSSRRRGPSNTSEGTGDDGL